MVVAINFEEFKPDQTQAIALLIALGYSSGDRVFLRFFYPEGDPRKKDDPGVKLEATFPELPWKRIAQLQHNGRGCYFVVNGQGHRDADIQEGRILFYEHDDIDKETSRNLWKLLGLPEPTAQVDTGGKSVHSYWKLAGSCTVQEWRELQTDLLEYANGDRKLKNPSRVMRLGGALHLKPGRDPIRSMIVSNTGVAYTYAELRAIVPRRQAKSKQPHQLRWHEFERSFQLPIARPVPLTVCLTKANRQLIEQGAPQGERNDRGFALACDLIGVTSHLLKIGQSIADDPRTLFEQYCHRCSPSIGDGEIESIWKSACQRAAGSSLAPDQIENCIKGWLWKQIDKTQPVPETEHSTAGAQPSSNVVEHPTADRVLSAQELQQRITTLLNQEPSQSDLEALIPEFARQAKWQSKDVWALYRSLQQEQEQIDSKQERATELEKLLKMGSYRLSLQNYLHPSLATPLEAISGYMGTLPAAMLYTLLPTAASLCQVGTKLELIQATNFYALPILYTGLVAESGTGKSPVQKTILDPLFSLQAEADELYGQNLADYDREFAEWSKDKEGEKPEKPIPREYYTIDVTREAIATLQSQQPNHGFLGWIDELSAIVSGRNQYRNGRGTDKEALLSGRDGSPIKVNRAGGKRLSAPQSAYSITGTTQPDTLKQLMGDFTDGAGEWARILWCLLPIQPAPFPDNAVTHDISERLKSLYQQIETLPAATYRLSPQALQLYRAWYNQLDELRLSEPRQALRSVYQKMKGDTGVLMLILHLINSCAVSNTPDLSVDADAAKAAISLAKYSISQVKLIHSLGEEARGELTPILAKLVEMSQRKGWITARDAKQGINALRVGKQFTSTVIRRMFGELCELGHGSVEGNGTRLRWSVQKSVVAKKEVLLLPSTARIAVQEEVQQTVDSVDGVDAESVDKNLAPDLDRSAPKFHELDNVPSTPSTIHSNPAESSPLASFESVDDGNNNSSTKSPTSTTIPLSTNDQRTLQDQHEASTLRSTSIPEPIDLPTADPDWSPQIGESVYVRRDLQWLLASVVAVPVVHSNPARSISCWKVRSCQELELLVWSVQDLRPAPPEPE